MWKLIMLIPAFQFWYAEQQCYLGKSVGQDLFEMREDVLQCD